MKGAREYAKLFETGQYGRLYITSSSHARGKIFHIQVLQKDELAKPNGSNMCLNDNAVEVYGIIGGHPGWTENYGWLHDGKWKDDFYKLVKEKKERMDKKNQADLDKKHKTAISKKQNVDKLLSEY